MMYQFDKGIARKGTNCVKWDVPFVTPDVTPMWIADMDFEIAPAITENLKKIAGQGAFGYQFLSDKYYEAVISWMERKHGLAVKREEILYVPNVVLGMSFAVQAVSEPGDEIIIMTPVYGPFFKVVNDNNRILSESPMKNDHGYYTMDLEDFESRITARTKAVIFCNPHNPSGRVWRREELKAFADVCMKHDLYIISDDIHSELISEGHEHIFISSLSEEIKRKCVLCTSPSKAFNLAGIHVANCFIFDEALRERYAEICEKSHAAENNAFAEAALLGAYNDSEEWLKELNQYINGNLDYFVDYVQTEIPSLTVRKPEGTYLVWVDFRKTGILPEELHEYLLKECRLAVNDGTFFGESGRGYARFNLACPRAYVMKALEQLKEKFTGENLCRGKK